FSIGRELVEVEYRDARAVVRDDEGYVAPFLSSKRLCCTPHGNGEVVRVDYVLFEGRDFESTWFEGMKSEFGLGCNASPGNSGFRDLEGHGRWWVLEERAERF